MPSLDLDAAFAAMRERYEGWLAEHGPASSQAVGWQDPAMQALRFDLLAQVMEGDAPVAVADFGCGTARCSRTSPSARPRRRWPPT
jgi:hypothetical protein